MIAALLAAAAVSAHGALPWIEDDYPAALARAKAEKKPLLIDFWATWCHTCLSMKRYVLNDPGMQPVAGEVVWLSIETETEKNKAAVEKYPIEAWPTFVVVDPAREAVVARLLGSASVPEFRSFVREGAHAVGDRSKPRDAAAAEQRKGDEAANASDPSAAAAHHGRAVSLTKAGDPRRPERLVSYANALRKVRTPEAARTCVEMALREIPRIPDGVVASDLVGLAQGCAESLPKDAASLPRLREVSIRRLQSLLATKDAPLSVDDRSDAFATLVELLDGSGRHDDAVAAARERAAMLENAANAAPDPTMASTFDPHRTDAYLYLKEPEKAEALLARREQEMPADYNPPARLARVLLEEQKLPDAEAAVDRALARAPRGQRRVSILGLKARILTAEGKSTDAVLREQLEVLRGLPKWQRKPEMERKIEEQLRGPSAAAQAH